jgi:hypothetical protein
MSKHMIVWKCHLCDQMKELRDSHVWPKFAYKRFAADQSKGGQFADLSKQRLSSEQYTRYWFCGDCEQKLGIGETYAAQLCSRIEADPNADQAYDDTLLRFATSISWRTLKAFTEDEDVGALRSKWEAYNHWKRYLRGSRPGINPYTQHLFVVIDKAHGLDRALGGRIVPELALVLSQIGPLFIVGQLDPSRLSADDERTWHNSRLRAIGGTISPVKQWKTGTKDPATNTITREFAALLAGHELYAMQAAVSGHWAGRKKR